MQRNALKKKGKKKSTCMISVSKFDLVKIILYLYVSFEMEFHYLEFNLLSCVIYCRPDTNAKRLYERIMSATVVQDSLVCKVCWKQKNKSSEIRGPSLDTFSLQLIRSKN